MSTASALSLSDDLNTRRLRLYLGLATILYLTLVCAMAFRGKLLYGAVLLAIPATLFIITHPRLALYTFVFLLFVPSAFLPGLKVYMYDVGAVLLILAAALDLLLRESSDSRVPPLFGNYIFVFIVLLLTGVFGYSLAASVRPMIRVLVTLLVFLSVYRLSATTTIASLLRFFFWICAAHAAVALAEFLIARGQTRSFGFMSIALDDFAMLAAPIGLGFFLWAAPGKSARYAIGTAVTFGGLIATQSRAPLLFAVASCGLLLLLTVSRTRPISSRGIAAQSIGLVPSAALVRRRVRWVVIWVATAVVAVFALKALLFSGVIGRFERLLTTTPHGTFRLRLVLWTEALKAFWQHPLMGIGPGNFRNLSEVMPAVRLDPLNYYVRGLSAHNLFLHYLAETGILGVTALLALFIGQFRLARKTWRDSRTGFRIDIAVILFTLSALLLFTTLFEAGWMWAEFSLVAAFLIALIARSRKPAA